MKGGPKNHRRSSSLRILRPPTASGDHREHAATSRTYDGVSVLGKGHPV